MSNDRALLTSAIYRHRTSQRPAYLVARAEQAGRSVLAAGRPDREEVQA